MNNVIIKYSISKILKYLKYLIQIDVWVKYIYVCMCVCIVYIYIYAWESPFGDTKSKWPLAQTSREHRTHETQAGVFMVQIKPQQQKVKNKVEPRGRDFPNQMFLRDSSIPPQKGTDKVKSDPKRYSE